MSRRVAFVTGGSRGLGRTTAERLMADGLEVVICGRNEPEDLPLRDGRTATFLACDVRSDEALEGAMAVIKDRFGRLDVLVNNAGGTPPVAAADASARLSEKVIALNLLAPLNASRRAYHVMLGQAEGGVIINIASVAATRPSPGAAAYGAAKAGLLNLTKTLAMEWGPKVRVNSIIVGLVDAGADDAHYGGAKSRERLAALHPLQRMVTGDDVAAAVSYLASPAADYLTGVEMEVHSGGEPPLYLHLS